MAPSIYGRVVKNARGCPLQTTSQFCYIHAIHVAPLALAPTSVFPLTSAFFSCPSFPASDFAALLALKDCSKSAIISSMCSFPTLILMRSSVTPLSVFSSSLSCSCVVVQGCIARVLESPTLSVFVSSLSSRPIRQGSSLSQIGYQLESINDLTPRRLTTLDPE